MYEQLTSCFFVYRRVWMKDRQRPHKFSKLNHVIALHVKQLKHSVHKQVVSMGFKQGPCQFIFVDEAVCVQLIAQFFVEFSESFDLIGANCKYIYSK